MTLIKSMLLGSAAGIVAVASAQAADLPTRKGPVAVEYVRVCSITVAGAPVVGFILPGSDTCFRISGYITGQIEGGNLYNGTSVSYITPRAGGGQTSTQTVFGIFNRDSFGYSTRYNFTIDAVSNTAYGPLVAHGEYQFNNSSGFDNLGQGGSDGSGINRAYVTWAGITAGKANSFFSFTGGGLGYANFFSPDRNGFNQPDLLAYTASFGGGFAASVSLEDPYEFGGNGAGISAINSYNGSYAGYLSSATEGGLRVPDIVGALSVTQPWGRAQVSAVAHNIRASSNYGVPATLNKWGYAVEGGVQFNIPSMSGSNIGAFAEYSRNATWYSGLLDGMWGEPGQQVNGNGQGAAIADAFYNGDGTWATPTAFTVTGYAQFTVNPQVTLGVEGSYGQLRWQGQNAASLLSNSNLFLVGGVAHYDPVKNLDFEIELLYENNRTSQPSGYTNVGCTGAVGSCTTSWQGRSDGFASRFQVTRSF